MGLVERNETIQVRDQVRDVSHSSSVEATQLPSFSIIIETENLSSAELTGLCRSLDSLAAQDLPPSCAQEVLILESGDVPKNLLEKLSSDYPWLMVKTITAEVDYYAAKMQGVALTTGEIVVFADSDCIYESNWLRSLLTPFAQDPDIQAIAGETRTSASGPYGLAISLTYIFPPFSRKRNLHPTRFYFFNNVAFRRSLLQAHPIPTHLPIYRGNCVIHARTLAQQGIQIWRQPIARAVHAAPNGLSHFFWRFILLGYDALLIYRLRRAKAQPSQVTTHLLEDCLIGFALVGMRVKEAIVRLFKLIQEQPSHLLNLPIALVIAVVSLLLFLLGVAIAYVRPNYFLSETGRVDVNWEPS